MVQPAEHRSTMISMDIKTAADTFATDVDEGLRADPKHLSCRYFYDYAGSLLFEEICRLPEYYLTRAETEILQNHADQIVSNFPRGISLVELGSGSCEKTRYLIEALSKHTENVLYSPIDISKKMLKESAETLLKSYPDLEIISVAGEYHEGLEKLSRHHNGPRCVLWLGSSIGNLELSVAIAFLRDVVSFLSIEDSILIGFDLIKPRHILEKAYNDSGGVTAQFNLNLLRRINSELGGTFVLDDFEHRAVYNDDLNRIEMYLVSLKAQAVHIEVLDQTYAFDAGERIHTENSHKYSIDSINRLAGEVGLKIMGQWFDGRTFFCTTLFTPITT